MGKSNCSIDHIKSQRIENFPETLRANRCAKYFVFKNVQNVAFSKPNLVTFLNQHLFWVGLSLYTGWDLWGFRKSRYKLGFVTGFAR